MRHINTLDNLRYKIDKKHINLTCDNYMKSFSYNSIFWLSPAIPGAKTLIKVFLFRSLFFKVKTENGKIKPLFPTKNIHFL